MARTPVVKGAKKEQQVREKLLNKEPIRAIARATGFSRKAIETYRSESLPEKLIQARNVKDIADADDVVEQIKNIQTRTLAVLDKVESEGDHALFFKGIREVRENAKLSAELAGKLQAHYKGPVFLKQIHVELTVEQRKERIEGILADYQEKMRGTSDLPSIKDVQIDKIDISKICTIVQPVKPEVKESATNETQRVRATLRS
jgi:hypothetical protein